MSLLPASRSTGALWAVPHAAAGPASEQLRHAGLGGCPPARGARVNACWRLRLLLLWLLWLLLLLLLLLLLQLLLTRLPWLLLRLLRLLWLLLLLRLL